MLKKSILVIVILFSGLLAIFSSISPVSALGCCYDGQVGPLGIFDSSKYCQQTTQVGCAGGSQYFSEGVACTGIADCSTGLLFEGFCKQPTQSNPVECDFIDRKAACNNVGYFILKNGSGYSNVDDVPGCRKGCCICIQQTGNNTATTTSSYNQTTQGGCAASCPSPTYTTYVFDTNLSSSGCTALAASINSNPAPYLYPNSNISGNVYMSGTTNPIVGATVSGGGATATTNSTGGYKLTGVTTGTYSVYASASGYNSNSVTVSVQSNQQYFGVNIALSQITTAAVIEGYVRDSNYTPIPGAQVILNTSPISTTTSNFGGFFSFANVQFGSYNVSASAATFLPNSTLVAASQPVNRINITLEKAPPGPPAGPAKLEVFVHNNVGANLPNAVVKFLGTNCPIPNQGPSSNCSYTNVFAGVSYVVQVDPPNVDYYPATAITPVLQAYTQFIVTLRDRPKWTISGKTFDQDDDNLPQVTVEVVDPSSNSIAASTVSDNNGNYLINAIPEGIYNLRARKQNYVSDYKSFFNISSNRANVNFKLNTLNCVYPIPDPKIISIDHIKNVKQLKINWENPCSADHYYVWRCKGAQACSEADRVVFDAETSLSYIDPTVDNNTFYCYQINATYSDPATSKLSAPNCTSTGDKVCYEKPGEFCYNGDVYECDSSNRIRSAPKQDCQSGSTCVSTSPGSATCAFQSPCRKCNLPLGIFAFNGKTLYQTNPDTSCISLLGVDWPCYRDFTDSSVDAFDDCSKIKSCYDYRSERACETENKCLKDVPQGCEWIETSYNQTGAGICRPKNVSMQNANLCNEKTYNQIFGGCTKEACALFGRGYCKDEDDDGICDVPGCIDIKDISCWDYSLNRTDCINTTLRNVSVNVKGFYSNQYTTTFTKTGVTNQIIEKSQDKLGLGVCRFGRPTNATGEASKCFKDADNSTKQDCTTEGSACRKDRTPPTTVVMHADRTNKLRFNVYVNEPDSTTRYKISDGTASNNPYLNPATNCYPGYPLGTATNGVIDPTADSNIQTCEGLIPAQPLGQQYSMPDGDYAVYYFSEDQSKNLEQLRNFTITLDRTPPNITLRVFKFVNSDNPQQLKTNLRIDVDADELVWCDAQLDRTTSPIASYASAINASTPILNITEYWSALIDGLYTYKMDCVDGVGNPISLEEQLTLDADNTISNPYPINTIGFTLVNISVQTSGPAECSYKQPTGSFIQFGTTGGTRHNQTIDFTQSPYNAGTGTVKHATFDVQCNITSTRQFVNASEADKIRVTIDLEPPTTVFTNLAGQMFVPPAEWWVSGGTFKLKCEDPQFNGTPGEFGCRGIKYCTGAGCTPTTEFSSPYQPPITADTIMRFKSVDLGGNEQVVDEKEVKYDPDPPIVSDLAFQDERIDPNTGEYVTGSATVMINGTIQDVHSDIVEAYVLIDGSNRQEITDYLSGSNPYTITNALINISQNTRNTVQVHAVDKAGNDGFSSIPITHDATPPTIQGFTIQANCQVAGCQFIPSARKAQAYYPSTVEVANVADPAGIGIVDSVWLIDPLGAKTDLPFVAGSGSRTSGVNLWRSASVQSQLWLVGNYTITIAANDSLGNVGTQPFNVEIIDNIKPEPPRSQLDIYDIYNSFPNYPLQAGRYYVVISSVEPLSDIVSNYRYQTSSANVTQPVSLLSRTFNGTEWLAYFDAPQNTAIIGLATLQANLTDRHNQKGIIIRAFNILNSTLPPQELPPTYTSLTSSIALVDLLNILTADSRLLTAQNELEMNITLTGLSSVAGIYAIGEDGIRYDALPYLGSTTKYALRIPTNPIKLVGARLQERQNTITLIINNTPNTPSYYGTQINVVKDLAPPELISLGIES